jgi:large subunit ribosomal protein L23
MSKTIILRPRLSEKTFGLSNNVTGAVYVFDVPKNVNKHQVAEAVAAQFEVTPVNVNITNVKGKPKRLVRKTARAISGRRSDIKKAFVTLAKGQSLPFFEQPEEKKEDKKADKKAAKTAKETK